MKKTELVAAMAEKSGLTKSSAEAALNAFIDVIKENVKDAPIPVAGFGKFQAKPTPAREMKSPRDGSIIKVPASNRVSFSAGKDLKESVNK